MTILVPAILSAYWTLIIGLLLWAMMMPDASSEPVEIPDASPAASRSAAFAGAGGSQSTCEPGSAQRNLFPKCCDQENGNAPARYCRRTPDREREIQATGLTPDA
jgi:hypothetical protein